MNDDDLDRLADFLGGALDGTPEEAEIRRLVDTEPGWAAAAERLSAAFAAVHTDLRVLAGAPVRMPADVAARIDAALAGAGGGLPAPDRQAGADPHGSAGRPHAAPVVPGTRRPGATPARPARARSTRAERPGGPDRPASPDRPGGRRPGRHRLATALAGAAAVLAIGAGVIVAVPWLTGQRSADQFATTNQKAADRAGGVASAPQATPIMVNSGQDYTRETVLTAADVTEATTAGKLDSDGWLRTGETGPQQAAEAQGRTGARPGQLDRLAGQPALAACLAAVTGQHGGRPTVVDYARFEGLAALVVVLVDAPEARGRRLIVVVGPACGQAGSGADERYAAPA